MPNRHVLAFFRSYTKGPLDGALRHYFLTKPSLGASLRRKIGDTIFGMMRHKTLLNHFAKDLESQLHLYQTVPLPTLASDPLLPPHVRLSTPIFLYEKLVSIYGKTRGESLCEILQSTPPVTLRVNLAKISREELLLRLQKYFPCYAGTKTPTSIYLQKREPLFTLREFQEGLFEVQDEGSQQVASLVQAKPGDWVLDLCAGSGGKTLAFAHQMEGKGQIFLSDIRPQALIEAKKRLKRAGIQNCQCLPLDHPQMAKLQGRCDYVLVDAPCSGSGTLRRNVEQKELLSQEMLSRLTLTQKELFAKGLSFLKPQGVLVYATCSIFPEENEEIVAHFLPKVHLRSSLVLLPEQGGCDGFFATSHQLR